MSKVFLNGELVDFKKINPKKHKYIGKFHKPFEEHFKDGGGGIIMCGCALTLHTIQDSFEHWQAGHWDTEQYVDIK